MKLRLKQVLAIIIFSIITSIAMIIHGVFIDLDFSEIKRLTITGFIVTFILIFCGMVLLEYIFDINNKREINKLNRKINKIKKK